MPDTPGSFAADLAALFRDPAGVTELRSSYHGDDATLSAAVFLQRCADRGEAELEPLAPAGPGNLVAQARWLGLTAMAAAWLGALRTWHETESPHRPEGLRAEVEQELYWRLAGGWPIDGVTLEANLRAWPLSEPEAGFGARLCGDARFRHSFDGVAARIAEIGERISLAQLVLRMTLPGSPVLYSEDIGGRAELATGRAHPPRLGLWPDAGSETTRTRMLMALQRLRLEHPELFDGPLVPIVAAHTDDDDDRVCAFMRGEALIVAVTVGDRATGACGWQLPDAAAGLWRDVLTGAEYELPGRATLAGVLGPDGRAVLVRKPS